MMKSAWWPIVFLLSSAALAVGCASIRTGAYATPVDASGHRLGSSATTSGLMISGREVTDLSSPYFGLVELTFENTSSEWVRIQRMNLDFGTPAKNQLVLVPWGTDITSWRDAAYQRRAIREANTEAALSLIAIGGAVVSAAAPRNSPARALGGLATVGSLTALVAKDYQDRVNALEGAATFPESHVLSLPFGVPPGLFSKKWILLNTRPRADVGCVRSMLLDYQTENGQTERVQLEFKPAGTHSEWQSGSCG
jgi:hypothetical protein